MLKGMSWHGGVFAPFDKGKLKAKQGIRFRTFATGWRYGWQSDGMLARVFRPDCKEVPFAYAPSLAGT